MEKEAEVKIQTDGDGEEKRRMSMTWRKNRKTDKEGGKEKHWEINKKAHPISLYKL